MIRFQSLPIATYPGVSTSLKRAGSAVLLWAFSSYAFAVAPPPGPAAQSCSTGFRLASSILINGNTQASGSTGAALDSLVTFNYADDGVLTSPVGAVPAGQVGSIWGMGYDASRQKMYASSFLKRHTGFGPDGAGAIYQFNAASATPSASLLIDLSASGVDVGNDPRVATSGVVDDPNELPAAASDPSWDSTAFDQVGKMSLGDIDVSSDGSTLWAMNLKQRSLVEIDLSGAAASVTAQHNIPDPGCSNGEFRPWAIKVHDNRVWLGMVCSAETSQSTSDLHAYITVFNGTQFDPVFDFPLNYPKGQVGNGPAAAPWQPWTSTLQSLDADPAFTIYPQPVLSDIEFDMDGSMILGFMDRTGHQVGGSNYKPDPTATDTGFIQGQTGGDILRVCNENGSYALEANGSCGGVTTAGAGFGQGVGGGEYYWADMWDYNKWNADGGYHKEISSGGLAFRAGSGEVVVTAMNPDAASSSGGVIWLDNATGGRLDGHEGLQLYADLEAGSGHFGKANGMGDVEVFCPDLLTCSLDAPAVSVQCDDAMTPGEPLDDVFSYIINTNGVGVGASYNINGDDTQSGVPYGSDQTFGSFAISGGDLSLALTDADDATCTLTGIGVQAPGTCSEKVDIQLEKSVSASSAKRGDTVVYTLTVSNESGNDATGIEAQDLLPAAVTWASDDSSGAYDKDTGMWIIGSLPKGESKVLNITVTID